MSEPASLPDRLDDALAALWAGSSDALDRLVGGESVDSPPIGRVLASPAATLNTSSPPPAQIGDYEVLNELGRGGMGIVYRAHQRELNRDVALKMIRGADFGDEQRIRLFQREVRTLARLRHPNIAALHGTGRTEDGRHFFVMELISGAPLSEYVATVTLGTTPGTDAITSILPVFCKVCDAITYAHQRGVIHRDIKPSNILVAADPESPSRGASPREPEVKVLDFGLARMIESDGAGMTATVDASRLKGTLPYMSPEQIVGDLDEVDVRADVYSLGVVLYQMLTGRLPFDPKKRCMTEIMSAIREETVPRPAGVNPWLRSDLETIVLKAVERDPTRRYQSVAALSDDIRRYLSDQPILARPPSFAYLSRKLVARHKLAFGAAAAILVISLSAGVVSAVSLARARAAQRDADRDRQVAESVSRFLTDTFSHIDPRLAKNRDTTLLRELLNTAAGRVESELSDQPQVRARLEGTFGNSYLALGLYDRAEPHLVRALSVSTDELGTDHPATLDATNNLATLRSDQGRLDEARRLHESALEVRRRVLGAEHLDTAMSLNNLGELYRQVDRLADAEKLLSEALVIRRKRLGNDHAETLITMNNLAGVWFLRGKSKPAEKLLRECLEGQLQALESDHLDVLVTKSDLAIVLKRNGDPETAEKLLGEVVVGFTSQLGAGHMDTLAARYNLAGLEDRRRTPDEAVEATAKLLADAETNLPPKHHLIGALRATCARRLFDARRYAEAEPHALRALSELEEALGRQHATTRSCADTVADIYEAMNEPKRAAPFRALSEGK